MFSGVHFDQMTIFFKNIFWILREISGVGFWVFLLTSLVTLFLDPYLSDFFVDHLPIIGFLGLSAMFFFFYLHQLIRSSPSV